MGTQTPLSGARVKPLHTKRSSTVFRASRASGREGRARRQSSMNQRQRIPRALIACLLSGRQKTALRRTSVLRNGSVFPLCRGQTLNFGGDRSTWNVSSASRDGHHIWDYHTGTRSTVAGRSARSLQRTSGNKAHGGLARQLHCSSRARVNPLPRPLELSCQGLTSVVR